MRFVSVAIGLVAAASTAARADVKIVAHLHGTAMGHALPEQVQTIYYKGDKMRSDQYGTSMIFDAKSGKVDVLRESDKTYFEVSADEPPPFLKSSKLDAKATVTPTDEHKTIAGMNASKYTISVHMTITDPSGKAQPIDMGVELWTTTDVKTRFVTADLYNSLGRFMRGVNLAGIDQVKSELAKVKGFPIEETVTLSAIPGIPNDAGSGTGPFISVVSAPDSVTEAPLGDDVFSIPGDYKKVDPPVATGGG